MTECTPAIVGEWKWVWRGRIRKAYKGQEATLEVTVVFRGHWYVSHLNCFDSDFTDIHMSKPIKLYNLDICNLLQAIVFY